MLSLFFVNGPELSVLFRQVDEQRFGVCLFWTVRYRSQAAAGTFFLGRPPFAPFARAAATLAGVFALPPFAPILDAAQFSEPNNPSSREGK